MTYLYVQLSMSLIHFRGHCASDAYGSPIGHVATKSANVPKNHEQSSWSPVSQYIKLIYKLHLTQEF